MCVEARSWYHDDSLLYVLKPGLLGNSGLPNGASLTVQLISGIPASASRILGVHGCWKF